MASSDRGGRTGASPKAGGKASGAKKVAPPPSAAKRAPAKQAPQSVPAKGKGASPKAAPAKGAPAKGTPGKAGPRKPEAARLAATMAGRDLSDEEARALWAEFSTHMDEHRGDMSGFAVKKGFRSVRPEFRGGRAVLLVEP